MFDGDTMETFDWDKILSGEIMDGSMNDRILYSACRVAARRAAPADRAVQTKYWIARGQEEKLKNRYRDDYETNEERAYFNDFYARREKETLKRIKEIKEKMAKGIF